MTNGEVLTEINSYILGKSNLVKQNLEGTCSRAIY